MVDISGGAEGEGRVLIRIMGKVLPKLRIFTLVFSAVVIGSAAVTRQLMDCSVALFGRGFFSLIVAVSVTATAVFLIAVSPRTERGTVRTVLRLFALLVLTSLWAAAAWKYVALPEEKFHLIMYAVLGLLVFRDCEEAYGSPGKAFFSAVIYSFACGAAEEGFQYLLPYRYFAFSDIILNWSGSIAGICAGLLGVIL